MAIMLNRVDSNTILVEGVMGNICKKLFWISLVVQEAMSFKGIFQLWQPVCSAELNQVQQS